VNVALGLAGVLTAGAVAEAQRFREQGYSNFGPAQPFDERRRNVGGYAQILGTFGERGSGSASVRVDDNQKYGNFTTWRVAAATRLARGLRAHAAAGTAFKEPSFLEVFSTAYTTGNADLRPERTASVEAGLAREVGRRALASATYFRQRFHDLIQYNGSAAPPTPSYQNVGAASADGVELELRAGDLGAWSGSASYTWLRTEVTDSGFGGASAFEEGKELLRRPEHSGQLLVAYRATRRVTLDAAAHYVGRRDDLDFRGSAPTRIRLPAYATVDVSSRVAVAHDVALTLRVTNLLDRSYEPVFNYAAARRMVFVGAALGSRP
jgi:vitamin B12 transporter